MIPDTNKINNEIKTIIKDMSFIIKKTHKIGVASAVISKCLLETDPFRKSLRENSNLLLGYSSNFHKKGPIEKEIIFGHIEETLTILERQFFTLWSSGDVSEKNYTMMKEVILSILKDLKKNNISYGESLMDLPEVGPISRVSFDKKWLGSSSQTVSKYNNQDLSILKDINKKELKNTTSETETPQYKRHVSEEKKDRINKILGFIKDKGDISVKDIMSVIEGVATKTIQRDLQYLIDRGQIKQTGERRWARYVYLR
jgi:hypothetical protein